MNIKPINITERGEIGISKMSVTYTQEGDCLEDKDLTQELTIEAVADVADIEEDGSVSGWFYRLSTGDGHWSVDSPDEIRDMLQDFESRLLKQYKNESYKNTDNDTTDTIA